MKSTNIVFTYHIGTDGRQPLSGTQYRRGILQHLNLHVSTRKTPTVFPRLHIIQYSIQINYYVKYGKQFTKNLTHLLFNTSILNRI